MLDLPTPCALIDAPRLQRNLRRMQSRMDTLGVHFRPHVKTSKCVAVAERQQALGARGITVSTLKEAEQFFDAGFDDVFYAVCLAPSKIEPALALQMRGCRLRLVVDSLAAAQALIDAARRHGLAASVLIEVDVDGHRSGVTPDAALLIDIGRALHQGGMQLLGVMTHAGSSYDCVGEPALQRIAEQERARCVRAAERLRAAGLPCPVVSVGSTPTALSAQHLDGVTEVRAGVYAFFDLVMAGVGVCALDDIALSVLTCVIGHQAERGWVIVDAGWMALSRDRGTQSQALDCGYGLVCDASGHRLDGWRLDKANQEHGIVSFQGAADGEPGDVVQRFPIDTKLRILPNHACATGAQHERYRVVDGQRVIDDWPRFNGW
jgi:threo-3-hydroxy-D-aspartate ammonia-lyase